MNKIISIITFLILTFTLASCQQNTDHIPLILYNEVDPYILEFKTNILESAQGVLTIDSYDAQNSQILQNEIIEDVLNEHPSVLIINPVDRLGAYTIIDKVKLEDIPIIFINREPLVSDMNSWNKVYYIGAPAENSAMIQAEMVEEIFGDPTDLSRYDVNDDNIIQLVILKGEQGHQDAEIRTEVIIDALEAYGYQLDIIAIEVCDWQEMIAFNKIKELYKNIETEIELFISNNDAMAIGAVNALIDLELMMDNNNDGVINYDNEPWIPVIGIDGIGEALELVEQGYLYGTVINDSEAMSDALIELAKALQDGTDLNNLSYELTDNKYIWVDYKRYIPE
jgi:methyl-galactoside transport system substrate-binding protein